MGPVGLLVLAVVVLVVGGLVAGFFPVFEHQRDVILAARKDAVTLKFQSLYLQTRGFPELKPPATPGSAGYDLNVQRPNPAYPGTVVTDETGEWLPSGSTRLYPTGLKIAIPAGYVGLIRSRSSAFKRGLLIQGTIDCDYRGEVKVAITNVNPNAVRIEYGKSAAQMILVPYLRAPLLEVDHLDSTDRGAGGFGSTGT